MTNHAVLMAVAWPLLLIAVFFPMSLHRYGACPKSGPTRGGPGKNGGGRGQLCIVSSAMKRMVRSAAAGSSGTASGMAAISVAPAAA